MATADSAGDARCPVHGPAEGLCLDFANTRFWRGTPTPTETLHGPEDLLRWGASALPLPPGALGPLRARWAERPGEAATEFTAAILLREAIFRAFAASAAGGAAVPEDIERLNAGLRAAPGRTRLRADGGGHGYAWDPPPGPGLLLAPVLWSAGDLLAGPRLRLVRQCANEHCRWLFVDDSKSGNRRWCSMASCGNRAKAHRHYARQKGLA